MSAVLKALPAPLPNVSAILIDARREIATAKLTEFQCQRIGASMRFDRNRGVHAIRYAVFDEDERLRRRGDRSGFVWKQVL